MIEQLLGIGQSISGTLVSYFGTISVVFIVLAYAIGLWRDPAADIGTRVTRAGAAGTLPFGFVLIVGAIDPAALSRFTELPRAPLALGGLAIVGIYFEAAKRVSEPAKWPISSTLASEPTSKNSDLPT